MKMTRPTEVKVRELFAWMERYQPQIYRGVVRRFAQPAQLAGIWDSIANVAGNAVKAASNFVSTQGLDKLLTAAEPFVKNELEKRQLALQVKRIAAGLPPTDPVTGAPMPLTPAPGTPPAVPQWVWFAGVAGGLGLLVMTVAGRRRGR